MPRDIDVVVKALVEESVSLDTATYGSDVAETDDVADTAESAQIRTAKAETRGPESARSDSRRRRAARSLDAIVTSPARLTVRARRIVVGLLAMVIVAAAAGLGYTWFATNAGEADAHAGQSALASARHDIPKVLSYDYRNIDEEFPKVAKSMLTGKFLDDYTELGASVIQPTAKRDQIVTNAEVVEASVVSAEQDSVTVLMFVNQTTTSKGMEGPRLDGSRVRAHLINDDGAWKISEFVPV